MLNNFDYYEFRASSVWNLFTEPKTVKSKEAGDLSETCKAFLHTIFLKEKYGFEKQQVFKYFDKGNLCEEKAIGLVNEVLFPTEFLEKNTVRKSNGYVTGECDNFSIHNTVIDTKCSWDIDTFHWADKDDKKYSFQLNTYGLLYNASNLLLCYCLLNTPKHLLKDNEVFYDYESLIPKENRLKAFKVETIPNFESILQQKVNKAREYLNTIKL